MIALSPTTSPSPAGTKAADTDGSDAGLSAVFASLVAALLNPAGAAVGSPAPAAPSAAPAPSLGNTAIAAVANGPQMMSLARPAGPTASPAFVLPETAIDQPKGAAPGGPAPAPALTTSTPGQTAAPILSAGAAAISQAANSDTGAAVIFTAEPATSPVAAATAAPVIAAAAGAAPAPSAAAVIQSRQPVVRDEPANDEADPDTNEPAATATATTSGTSPSPVPAKGDEEEADEIDLDAVPHHAVIEPASPANHGIGQISAAAKATNTAPAAAVEPHQQIAAVVSPLQRRGDGSYRLTLHLKPEELGNVDLHIDLHHGTLDLHMHTDNQQAHDVLVGHLDDLRSELERAGLKAGAFDVGTGDQRRQPHATAGQTRPAFGAPTTTEAEPTPVAIATAPADDSTVDVRA